MTRPAGFEKRAFSEKPARGTKKKKKEKRENANVRKRVSVVRFSGIRMKLTSEYSENYVYTRSMRKHNINGLSIRYVTMANV